jgi:hypothetical protein
VRYLFKKLINIKNTFRMQPNIEHHITKKWKVANVSNNEYTVIYDNHKTSSYLRLTNNFDNIINAISDLDIRIGGADQHTHQLGPWHFACLYAGDYWILQHRLDLIGCTR